MYEAEGVYTCRSLNYSISSPRNLEISTISDVMMATALTTDIDHMASKEVQLEGGRYNSVAMGYFYRKLPYGKRCRKRSLGYCNDF